MAAAHRRHSHPAIEDTKRKRERELALSFSRDEWRSLTGLQVPEDSFLFAPGTDQPAGRAPAILNRPAEGRHPILRRSAEAKSGAHVVFERNARAYRRAHTVGIETQPLGA